MALDRARLETIGRAVPGVPQTWRALLRAKARLLQLWNRWVKRHPVEVVKSNSKEAFDYFFDQDEFIETEYLCQARLDFLQNVAEFCGSVAEKTDGEDSLLRVIDIGCGTGHLLLALGDRIDQPLHLYGLDFSDSAIRRARQLVKSAQFVVASVYAIPYPDESFDLVTCTETLEHLERPESALQEMSRVLRTGGHLVITVPNGAEDDWSGHVNFWNAEELRQLIVPYGVQHVAPTPPDGDLLAHAIKTASAKQMATGAER